MTTWDYIAYFLVYVALLNLIIAPLDIFSAAFRIHKIENSKTKKHVALDIDESKIDHVDDE